MAEPENKNSESLSFEQARHDFNQKLFSTLEKLTLNDITKTVSKTYTTYTKDNYRTYIQNPKTNEKNLREMSRFFYRVSNPYKRLLRYYTSIPLFYWNLLPRIDIDNPPETETLKKQYYKMLNMLNRMNLPNEMRNVVLQTLVDGVFYGFIYEDNNSFFIHKLDPDYCKIAEIESGCYNFAFDFSYFDKNSSLLQYYDPYFSTMYQAYKNDTKNLRWQIIDSKRSICIKSDFSNSEVLPAFVGIFEALIDLIDMRTLQRSKDEIENYKLIVQKIPFLKNSNEVEDFSLQLDTAVKFNNKLADAVPSKIGVVLSPMDIDTVDFKTDDADNDLLATSMRSVFDDSGTSQMLFNSAKSGSVGLDASIKTDVAYVWEVVESIERWIKRYIEQRATKLKFDFEILRVDVFYKSNAVDLELKLANSGVPNKLKLAATAGINPVQTMSSQYFENEILGICDSWTPLKTSYTMSGDSESIEINDGNEVNKDHDGNKEAIGQ